MSVSPHNPQQQAESAQERKGSGRYEPTAIRTGEELRAVVAVGRVLAGKLDHNQVLAAAVAEVSEIVGAENSSVLLIDPSTGRMSFHVAAGPGADQAKAIPLPPGEGICGHVARTGESLIINDAQNDPRLYRAVDQKTTITTRNMICVPLRSSERLWGVLELINKHHRADFDKEDLCVAEAIASQIALALENAHLHTEIVRNERMAAVGATVSGLAHCIKNVLNGIRSGSAVVDRALREDDFPRVRQGWTVVNRNSDMLSSLVLDMLSLARDSKVSHFPTDVNDLAEQITGLMADRAAERDIQMIFTPAKTLDEAMTDPTHLYRCLLNLVTNAIDACDDGGCVRVQVHRAAGRNRFTVSVADNGGGIAPEHRAKLFAEFFTTKGGKGTGLGLPVTRKLINQLGGKITFHSMVGRGRDFVIALPIEPKTSDDKETPE